MRRLRWQLTLSHLIAIAFTLVSMVGAAAVLGSVWWNAQSNPDWRTAQLTREIAQSVGGMVPDLEPGELNTALRLTVAGHLQPAWGPTRGPGSGGPTLDEVSYIAFLTPDGHVLASSTPDAAAFAPPERSEWPALVSQALANQHDLPVRRLSGSGPAVLRAAPVFDASGRNPIGVVLVGLDSPPTDARSAFAPLAFFGVATIAVLAGSFVFALLASSIVGYLLSRRLVGRLEQLSAAAEGLRGGDLTTRVAVSGQDEVSQLQGSFNTMAANTERTMRDLAAERDRVSGLLEAQRQLVASVSHELRTPIATVRGYLESALRRDGQLPSELKADLDVADSEVARLEGMVDELFTLSRAEVGRLELRPTPTDVGALVRGQVETQAPLAWHQRQVQLLAEVPDGGPVSSVDPQRLTQVVSNLLSNAVRHTPPGGLVAARVIGDAQAVRIEVRDTGEGIAAEALPRVFERFYQGSGGHPRAGAGLGLALVKELVESMGGSVQVHSTIGEGSTFSIRLPA